MREDRWSGQVAFPGGQRDANADKDDLAACVRETYEELGIPLDAPDFIYMGRMADYELKSRMVNNFGIVQSRFVFLHVGDLTPSLHLNTLHVESVQWFPLSKMTAANIDATSVMHSAKNFFTAKTVKERHLIQDHISDIDVYFPSVSLPGRWKCWGLTLQSTSHLLELNGHRPIAWPLFRTNSPVFNAVIAVMHGYWEITDRTKPHTLTHKIAFFSAVSVFFGLFYCFLSWEHEVGAHMAELKEHIRLEERRKHSPYSDLLDNGTDVAARKLDSADQQEELLLLSIQGGELPCELEYKEEEDNSKIMAKYR